MTETCPIREILLVEDDLIDAIIVRRVLKEIGVNNALMHVPDGRRALALLTDPKYPKPCAILLDLDMPHMTGMEFLEVVNADEMLRGIPVAVMTASDNQEDWVRSLELGAVAFIFKCEDSDEFRRKIEELKPHFGALESSPHARAGQMQERTV